MAINLRALVEAAFDCDSFEEAMVSQIADFIDYDDIASTVLSNESRHIASLAAEIAEDYL